MELIRRSIQPARARREAGGFTLLEVLIAMTVMAFGLLGLAAMQLYSLGAGRQGKHTNSAIVAAQDRMEELQHLGFAGLADTLGAWTTVRTVNHLPAGSSSTTPEMAYVIDERITDTVVGWTKAVDVRVTWNEPDVGTKQIVVSTVRYNY